MKTWILLVSMTILLFNPAYACLNGERIILKDGTVLFEDREGYVPEGHNYFYDGRQLEDRIAILDSLYKLKKDIDYLSDKGLLLILLRRYEEAITLYLKIEKIKPNRYSTASNIGTAYELAGQNDKALKWITKAVAIDSTSHRNSEWIHINILKAKIKGPEFYTAAYLLNTDFGNMTQPVSNLSHDELAELSSALYFQLNERISFVKPKEKIVAQLLFELGNIDYLLKVPRVALENYAHAKKYGFTDPIIDTRINHINMVLNPPKIVPMINTNGWKPNYIFISIIVGALFLMISVSIYLQKRKR